MIDNPANRQFIQQQIKRISGTQFFDQLDEEAKKELARALLSAADCQEQAREIVTEWHKQGNTRYPTPGDLYVIGRQLQDPGPAPPPPAPCDDCRDTPGWVRVTLQILPPSVFAGETRQSLVPCSCGLGKLRQAGCRALNIQSVTPAPDFRSPKELIDTEEL